MKAIKLSAFVIVASMVAWTYDAEARTFADIYTDCGLGAMIAPNNDAVAAVTNVTWDLGTTAISSEISSPDTCQGGEEKTAAFIYEAYPSLEKNLAAGYGEHLDALLALASCDAANRGELVADLREGFAAEVSRADYSELTDYHKAEGLYTLFNNTAQQGYACNIA